ncbi:MAG: peptidoglycan DD-metalloendopeptidase family protein [Acidobacteria bacterium]|nr:peptidoglycan DD-metalloendopeptidase family protein [Acidobacteriota bacterium]MYF13528.1 peptidoglycan DD-metalloendopeptidase family protein [Acidobacteriota bacterium]MYI97472.1 peptidoglycan DD-metalloendopeptidase family protein [Acidobacteriota bacterium]
MRQAPHFASATAVIGGLLGGVVLFGVGVLKSWNGPLPEAPGMPAAAAVTVPDGPQVGLFSVPDRFARGDSLSDVLVRNGLPHREVGSVSAALTAVANVRRLKVGQTIWLHRDERGHLARIELPLDDFREVAVLRTGTAWDAHEFSREPLDRREVVQGEVDSSLYQSLVAAGERPDLAGRIARALEYDIDFHRDTRAGDSYSAVVDKLYDDAGEWKGYGDLHAVRYINAGRPIHAFRFELPTGESGYYDYEGNSIQRAFLMSPVEYTRISGVFTSRRLHPIHRVYRPHYGVDYVAPLGTPVRSTADGVVTDAGNRGPNGIMVTLRHAGGYMTKYLHLSRLPPEIRAGRRVSQRDVIGFVGSTGVSTGPHLDYRLYRHGKPLNPRTHILPPGPPIPGEHLPVFEAWRDELVGSFEQPARRAPARTPVTVVGGTEGS